VSDERRKNKRFPVDVPARLIVGNESLMGRLRDVCRDAAYVEANRWFPLQTPVSVAMELPGTGGPLEVRGTVIRLAPGDQGTHGLAILFEEVTPAAALRIDFFISQQEG
jgi:PilZ domain